MCNCIDSIPTIEESLNNISTYIEGFTIFFFILGAVYLLSKLIKFIYYMSYSDNLERNNKK